MSLLLSVAVFGEPVCCWFAEKRFPMASKADVRFAPEGSNAEMLKAATVAMSCQLGQLPLRLLVGTINNDFRDCT